MAGDAAISLRSSTIVGTAPHLRGEQDIGGSSKIAQALTNKLRRRLNLIVYLNKTWKPELGALEIHSNQRRPEENQIRTCDTIFKRAILFETNEYSWHGFPRITRPADQRHLSQKSIPICLYTKDRLADEIAPRHALFYAQCLFPRGLPNTTLSRGEDVAELRRQFIRRDG